MLSIQTKDAGNIVIAQADAQAVLIVENNWYFAPEQVNMDYLTITTRTYTCPYKGVCYWIDLNAPDKQVRNIAWVYYDPKPGYETIKGRIAFYARETSATLAQNS